MRILEEQNGKNCAAGCCSEPLGFGKHRDHDRRGGEGESKSKHGGRGWRLVQDQGQTAKRRGRAKQLQGAEPEDEPADDRQTLPRQFEADHE